jgi:hypothetical protein
VQNYWSDPSTPGREMLAPAPGATGACP